MNIPESVTLAVRAAVRIHGRKAKTAIRNAWYNGSYRNEGLGDFSGELQGWRNSDGRSQLKKLRLADFAS